VPFFSLASDSRRPLLCHRPVGEYQRLLDLGDDVLDDLDVAVDIPDRDARCQRRDDLDRPARQAEDAPVARASSAFCM
jgi:hypothetical protein